MTALDTFNALQEPAPTVDNDGVKHWFKNNQRHRVYGPAVIYPNGAELWYLNGQRHRADGPAILWANGQEFWYEHGVQTK